MTYHSGGMVDAVAGIAHRAITDRLGYEIPDAVIGITTPDPESGAVILHVNSGGNALACGEGLRSAGYPVEPMRYEGHGAWMRVFPSPETGVSQPTPLD